MLSAPPESSRLDGAFEPVSQKKPTLLIVDDEDGPRQAIRIVFKDDYHILMADNGHTAINLAKQHPIDAAVLDIRMAGMNGIEVLNALKALDPSTEVVMLTAYETLETARQALRLGACDYLNKPFDIATLRDAIRTAMERRFISLQIRANNQRLRDLQQEIQNQKMREELARTRGEIYASIIHDINGPLTIISGFIDVINQRIGDAKHLEGEKLDMVKDRLTRITRQVSSCIQISNRYLSFLRGCASEGTPVKVNQILTDLGELLRTHSAAKNNSLVVQPLEADILAQINGTDLIQILLNLAINAFQCSEQAHRVEISAEIVSVPLDLARLSDGPQDVWINRSGLNNVTPLLAFHVSDDGPGVGPDVITKVFEPYFTTKPVGQGTGLGLAIVKRLIEQAHGAIHLHSQPGVSTAFTVYLPAQASSPTTA
jgi:signal transduction histidine kinase